MNIYNVWKIIIIIKFTYFDIFSNIIGREETPHKVCVQYKGPKRKDGLAPVVMLSITKVLIEKKVSSSHHNEHVE